MIRIIIIGILLLYVLDLAGQRDRHTKIESAKIAYMTKELDLSPSESADFWPLYNDFQKEKNRLYKKHKAAFNDISLLSDAEADELVNDFMAYQKNQFELSKAFMSDLREIFPARKVLKFHKADREFKRELLKKAKKRKAQE